MSGTENTSQAPPSLPDDSDELARSDFAAIKGSKRVSDWQWFVDRHEDHHLAAMVKNWIAERSSAPNTARRLMPIITFVTGLFVAAASVGGAWIAWLNYRASQIDEEVTLDTSDSIVLAPSDEEPQQPQPLSDPSDDPDYLSDWQEFFNAQKFQHFNADEVLFLGVSNQTDGACSGLNSLPPRELWTNIVPTLRTLELLRERVGAPIRLISIYRNPAYNRCIHGSSTSTHLEFEAIDFVVNGSDLAPLDWAKMLATLREDGNFQGGIGVFDSFVHLDTRGNNVTWPASFEESLPTR